MREAARSIFDLVCDFQAGFAVDVRDDHGFGAGCSKLVAERPADPIRPAGYDDDFSLNLHDQEDIPFAGNLQTRRTVSAAQKNVIDDLRLDDPIRLASELWAAVAAHRKQSTCPARDFVVRPPSLWRVLPPRLAASEAQGCPRLPITPGHHRTDVPSARGSPKTGWP